MTTEKIELLNRVEQLEDEVIRLHNNSSRDRIEIQRIDKMLEKLILESSVSKETNQSLISDGQRWHA